MYRTVVPWSSRLYGRGVIRIIQESGPPRGNYMVDMTKIMSLIAKVKPLKAKVLYLTVYYYYYCYYDDDVIIHCNNFSEKYWAVVDAKLSIPLGDQDY